MDNLNENSPHYGYNLSFASDCEKIERYKFQVDYQPLTSIIQNWSN